MLRLSVRPAVALRFGLAMAATALVCSSCASGTSNHIETVGSLVAGAQTAAPQEADAQPGLGAAFPPPSALVDPVAGPRAASYTEDDLFRVGKFYEASLPHAAVSDSGDDAVFEPNWQPGGGTDGLAYCMYNFPAQGFDRAMELHYSFATPPTDWGTVWFATAEWSADRWIWRQADPSGNLTGLLNTSSFDVDGRALIIIVCMADGDTPALSWVYLGPPQVTAKIQTFIHTGVAPLAITADASASDGGPGEITKYEWDWDGDGTFDEDTGDVATAEHTYDDPGEYAPAVRVTSSLGIADIATTSMSVTAPWTHNWGGADDDHALAVAVDGSNNAIYFGGYTASYGQGEKDALLMKFDLSGNLIWARAWGGAQNERITALASGSDGSVYAGGYVAGTFSGNCLLQHWSADGALLWSRTWGGELGYDRISDLALYGSSIYAVGSSQITGGQGQPPDCLVGKFDLDGYSTWARTFGGEKPTTDHLEGIAVVKPLFGDIEVYVAGTLDDTGAGTAAVFGQFSDDGSAVTIRQWNGTGKSFGTCVAAVPYPAPTQVYIGGYTDSPPGGYDGMLVKYQPLGNPLSWGWSMGGTLHVEVLSVTPLTGGFMVGGSTAGLGAEDSAFLAQLKDDGTTLLSREYGSESGVAGAFEDLALFPGRGIVGAGTGTLYEGNTWENFAFIPRTITGTWEDAGITPVAADGTSQDTSGTVLDVSVIPVDSNGGGNDGLFTAQPLVQ